MKVKLLIAAGVLVSLTACAPTGPVEPVKSPRDLWIEAHPTSIGDAGECIEFDGEECDDDPYDLDDMFELDKPSKRPVKSPAPRWSGGPKPKTTRR